MEGPETKLFGIVRVGDSCLGINLDRLSEVCHVDHMTPLPQKSNLLVGGFGLRGSLVPVLDLEEICGLKIKPVPAPLCVVIKKMEKVLAFRVDEVMDISRIGPEDIQALTGAHHPYSDVCNTVFSNKDGFVTILDVDKLFDYEGVFAATRPIASDNASLGRKTAPMLVFEAGKALFALPAIEVYAAVPRQTISVMALTGGACLGEISYYNRRVPIVCPIQLFGLGSAREGGTFEIVVVRFPEDRLLGFAVDAIRTIRSFSTNQATAVPAAVARDGLITGINVTGEGRQIYTLEPAALHAHSAMREFASLSDRTSMHEDAEPASTAQAEARNVVHEKARYLVVEAGRTFAIPLSQVNCILDPPREVTPARSRTPGFQGYFSRLGRSVALINLSSNLGLSHTAEKQQRVVLTGSDDAQIGFSVDRIVSIEVSNWREKAGASAAAEYFPAVQLGASKSKFVLPLLDLEARYAREMATG